MECFISIEDKYELEDIKIFSIEADCDFEFQGSYENIWISFDEETNEMYRIIEIPDNVDTTGGCGNSTYSLDSFNTYKDALVFFENLKTISFKKFKKLAGYPANENLCYFKTQKKKILSTDDNEVEIIKTYHQNGAVKEEIETVNGKGHGLYKQYYDQGQLKSAIKYENGNQVDGIVDSFDENGMLIRTVEIINGNLNGTFKEFYPSGTIKKEGQYKDDEVIGKPVEYYEDGNIKADNEENENLNS
jgi:antitoxin component YwqK of YwqJK toxin-antitoxin module